MSNQVSATEAKLYSGLSAATELLLLLGMRKDKAAKKWKPVIEEFCADSQTALGLCGELRRLEGEASAECSEKLAELFSKCQHTLRRIRHRLSQR